MNLILHLHGHRRSRRQLLSSPLLLIGYFLYYITSTNISKNHILYNAGYYCLFGVYAIPYDDEIISLPLYDDTELPSPQFSGYLNGTDGCNVDLNGPYCYIHYWLCLADYNGATTSNVKDDTNIRINASTSSFNQSKYVNNYPVVVWLNGGPGSSSILGLLQEIGPLLFNATGNGFMNNPFSWTKIPANILILESPIGVGYSYCSAQELPNGLCYNTDAYTASTARAAIVDFVHRKFPEYRSNPLYITGESYAGVYIPTLAYEIMQYNKKQTNVTNIINIQGVAVGDPCTDNVAQQDSMDALWYSNKYGLMDDQIYDVLWNKCQARIPSLLRLGKIQWRNQTKPQNTKFYHLLQNRYKRQVFLQQQIQQYALRRLKSPKGINDTEFCDLAWKKFLFSTSKGLSQNWDELYIDDYSLYSLVSNDEDDAMSKYMNRRDVRQALHVTQTPNVQQWPYPIAGFDYTKEYSACNDDVSSSKPPPSMIDFYKKIIPNLYGGTLIYNGDTDPCVSYEGTRTAVKRIGFLEIDGGGYRPWFYNHTGVPILLLQEKAILFGPNLIARNAGIQFGGEVVNYEYKLSFLTVHGSGHMVPQFRPQASFHFISKFIHNISYISPLLPNNNTLFNMSEAAFDTVLNEWTNQAKSKPFI